MEETQKFSNWMRSARPLRKPCLTPDKFSGRDCDNEQYCDNCREWWSKHYPQGWSYYAGDTCKHGVYVGGSGVDWMCGACEGE